MCRAAGATLGLQDVVKAAAQHHNATSLAYFALTCLDNLDAQLAIVSCSTPQPLMPLCFHP